jgi:hypothetical protein
LSLNLPLDGRLRPPVRGVFWYESGDRDSHVLQVNTYPHWYAAVFAIRFRIFTGWHRIPKLPVKRFPKSQMQLAVELFHTCRFDTVAGRRRYRKDHPETAGFTWAKIRALGPATFD